jgi:citrate lyase subunit beta/citryl-CoA lyase
VINEVFGPSVPETEFYQGLVAAYEEAARAGSGAARYRGLHIDRAHYDKARQWLEDFSPTEGGSPARHKEEPS